MAGASASQSLGKGLSKGCTPAPLAEPPPSHLCTTDHLLTKYNSRLYVQLCCDMQKQSKRCPTKKPSLGRAEGHGLAASRLLFHCGRSVLLLDGAVALDVLVFSLGTSPLGAGQEPYGRSTQAMGLVIIISFSRWLFLRWKIPAWPRAGRAVSLLGTVRLCPQPCSCCRQWEWAELSLKALN